MLTTIVATSCFGRGNITEDIIAQKAQLSETDISALSGISMEKLRVAKDTKDGALYYAGLLWYLNDKTNFAEIAWKRSAKTSTSIWRQESTRLVCYLLTRESRYNQIIPFIDSVLTPRQILEDPEVFAYYTRALWSVKDFKKMTSLLAFPPEFQQTLRSRISVNQARFYYDMWKAIIDIMEKPADAEAILALLFSKYSYKYTDPDIHTFLRQIPFFYIENLPEHTQALIELRDAEITSKEAFDILINLPVGYYQNYWVTLDLLNVSQKLNSTYRNQAYEIFEKAKGFGTDNNSRAILSLAQADIAYKRKDFTKSVELYKIGLELIKYDINKNEKQVASFLKRSQWRFLYSVIETDADKFFPHYISTIRTSSTPNYFTDLLEEQLSHLLQKNKKSEIQRQYFKYSPQLTDIEQQAELFRWQTIIARLNPTFEIDISKIKNLPTYYSSTPFDYLVNQESRITQQSFFNDWVQNSVVKNNPVNDIDRLINGYIDYGLGDYGYSIALENISQLNNSSIQTLSRVLYESGSISQSLTLLRIAVSYNKNLINDISIMKQLYPTPYLDILETVTKSPIEQAIMLALMREESSFDHDIRSHANAIGLTQLLQATAEDIASRIDFEGPIRLTDPQTNITLGYWYFKYLVDVLETPLKAIASYNGGLGNVWKWEKKYDDKNLILFADSLPYRETRNYIRKVSSSAMIYGLLYFGISPNDFQKFLLIHE